MTETKIMKKSPVGNWIHKLTPEQRTEIAERYVAGESTHQLANVFGIRDTTVGSLLKSRNIPRRLGGHSKLDKNKWKEIADRYSLGEKSANIAKDFNIRSNHVLYIAQKLGIPVRGIWDSRGRFKINHSAFSIPSPEANYWAGFLMADGTIHKEKNSVSVALASQDLRHIKKFKKFLGAEHKITKIPPQRLLGKYTSKGAYSFGFASKQIVMDLAKYGVVPRKSLTARIIGGMEYDRDFLRGLIDGDGSIAVHKTKWKSYAKISLCGSKDITRQFSDFMKRICPNCKAEIKKTRSIFAVSTAGNMAVKIIENLYKDSTVYLDRKYIKAMGFVNNHGVQYADPG